MFSFFRMSFKKDIKLICFDLDNTLCDFAKAETETEVHMAEFLSREIKRLQTKTRKSVILKNSCSAFTILKIFNEVKREFLYRDLLPETYSRMIWFKSTLERLDDNMALGISLNDMILNASIYEKKYWEEINKRLKNYPHTLSTLDSLKSGGFKLATITDSDGLSGMKDIRIKLLGLDKYLDYIITGDNIGLNKPAIENWNKLLELSKLKGSQCVMVGDHPEIDLVTAKKLGFTTVWTKQSINSDIHIKYVDYEIHEIKEIITIVRNLV
jgi:HAD superfamily hydrolase (TIGR01509 family)